MKQGKILLLILVLLMTLAFGYPLRTNTILEGMTVSLPTPLVTPSQLQVKEGSESIGEEVSKTSGESSEKCRPCPPCGRCPEPSFECKKVPTYSHITYTTNPPMAVNPDYTTFGV